MSEKKKKRKTKAKPRDKQLSKEIKSFHGWLIEEVKDIENWDKNTHNQVFDYLDYLKDIMRIDEGRYWDECQEMAVIVFQRAHTQQLRDMIYNQYLRKPIDTMTESVIRRYHKHWDFYDEKTQFDIVKSDLIKKFHKFDTVRAYNEGLKSYSYYGTIIKNYCTQEASKIDKNRKRFLSYEKYYYKREDLDIESENYYEIDYDVKEDGFDLLYEIIDTIEDIVDAKESALEREQDELRKNDITKLEREIKVGKGLVQIFEYAHIYFGDDGIEEDSIINKTKLLKDTVITQLEVITGLEQKDVKKGLKEYKTIYKLIMEQHGQENS